MYHSWMDIVSSRQGRSKSCSRFASHKTECDSLYKQNHLFSLQASILTCPGKSNHHNYSPYDSSQAMSAHLSDSPHRCLPTTCVDKTAHADIPMSIFPALLHHANILTSTFYIAASSVVIRWLASLEFQHRQASMNHARSHWGRPDCKPDWASGQCHATPALQVSNNAPSSSALPIIITDCCTQCHQ